nr:hypothetical protein [Smithellaceae bacterium]
TDEIRDKEILLWPKWLLLGISVWGVSAFGGNCCDFVDEECVFVEKAHQISLMGLSKWLPGGTATL